MSTYIEEQETVVNILRTDERADVYTSDTTMMTKLDHIVEDSEYWKHEESIYDKQGNLVAKRYSCPKKLISFRSSIIKRVLTDEQRQVASDRLKAYWEEKRAEEREVQEENGSK